MLCPLKKCEKSVQSTAERLRKKNSWARWRRSCGSFSLCALPAFISLHLLLRRSVSLCQLLMSPSSARKTSMFSIVTAALSPCGKIAAQEVPIAMSR